VNKKRVLMCDAGKAVHFDPTDTSNIRKHLGFANNDASVNTTVMVYHDGVIVFSGWGLTPDAVYYATTDGNITTTPPSTGIKMAVGVAIDSNSLKIEFSEPVIKN
jgi:hypothetical protein